MPVRGIEREEFWRGVITRQAESGLSVAKFCKRETLAEQSFYAWKKKLRERDQVGRKLSRGNNGSVSNGAAAKSSTAFVPVEIEQAMPAGAIRIQWPSGVCVEVPCGVKPHEIAGILQTLHQLDPLRTENA